MQTKQAILTVFLFLAAFAAGDKLPSYIARCDPTYGMTKVAKCLEETLPTLLPRLSGGIPELMIPSVDPMVVVVGYRDKEREVLLTSVIEGFSQGIIENVTMSKDGNTFYLTIMTNLSLSSSYETDDIEVSVGDSFNGVVFNFQIEYKWQGTNEYSKYLNIVKHSKNVLLPSYMIGRESWKSDMPDISHQDIFNEMANIIFKNVKSFFERVPKNEFSTKCVCE